MQFSPLMFLVIILSFAATSFFMGMLVHSSFMYEDRANLKKDSREAWALCMVAGTGITGWLFYYGYYANFVF